ncbi:MAG: glycosyltransferase [Rhodospirillales bacterium]
MPDRPGAGPYPAIVAAGCCPLPAARGAARCADDEAKLLPEKRNPVHPGFVANPLAFMRRAALLVLTSRWEGLPTVLVEAMATGTPVVATDCPSGPTEILEGGRWGRLVPVGDVTAMAEAIVEVLDQPPTDSRPRAMEFSDERAVAQYYALIMKR